MPAGKNCGWGIDSGDEASVLDAGVAKKLNLVITPYKGEDGQEIAGLGRTTLKNLKVGDAALGDVEFLTMDLASDIKKDQMPDVDGTIAYTAFKDRILQLDYKAKVVRVSDALTAKRDCPAFCGEMTLPTFGKKGPPIVVATGFAVNGKPITAQIDTMYAGTLLIYPTSVEKLGLTEQAKSSNKRFFNYTDGGVDMLVGNAESEGFGTMKLAENVPVYFATKAVHLPDGMFDGTVGQELFQGRVLTMDFHAMRVWMSE